MAKQYFELLNLDNEQKSTPHALGIPQERVEFIEKEILYLTHVDRPDLISQSLALLVKKCETIEEVVWACFMLGEVKGTQARPLKIMSMIDDILGGIRDEADD